MPNGYLSPAEVEAMLQVGTLDQDREMLARKLAQVDALREQPKPHSSGLGGAFGAASQILDNYTANKREGQANQMAAGMKSDQLSAMRAMIEALKGDQRPPPAMTSQQPVIGLDPNVP